MLELALANARIGAFHWDFPSGALYWDERMCDLFGVPPERFDRRIESFDRAVHAEDREQVDEAVSRSLRTGDYRVTFRIVRADGVIRWVTAQSAVRYDSTGRPQGMVGVAQDRTEEIERHAARQARRELVLNATRGFAAALSTADVINNVTETVLPEVRGERLAIYLRESRGAMRLAGSRGFDEDAVRVLRRASHLLFTDPGLAPLWRGEPLFLRGRREYRKLLGPHGMSPLEGERSWALLPLTSAEGLVGVCVIVFGTSQEFSGEDQTVYTALAGILGQALARTQLYDERRAQITELQRMMLPKDLPRLPGLDLAVRYRPSSKGMDVGGDWYDVLPMADGRTALIIGDVQGHSAQAAAVMGHLRTAMRAHATDATLDELMARGNQTLCELDTDLFATCCVVEADPRRGVLRIVRAGHTHPLLLPPDGTARELRAPAGLPLGVLPQARYETVERELPPDSVLLLYTDGLVERPGQDYDTGVAELSDRLAAQRRTRPASPYDGADDRADLDDLAERLVTPAVSGTQYDDVAVLLVRSTRPASRAHLN
ncbi:SpoIIE family protein phosphatase [Streptomyces sp. NPDC005438]|uniref:SpoIIE family protein phosphatase n=1 Tax=Streptomyces sp. NPDC005438 TaxID=3156880 RepID=UPI0033B4818A